MNAHKPISPTDALANHSARDTGEAGVSSPVPSVSPTFACPECEGAGFFTVGNFHPDDPRIEASWDCDVCGGSGEVDYETPAPRLPALTMEQVEAQIANAFDLHTQAMQSREAY